MRNSMITCEEEEGEEDDRLLTDISKLISNAMANSDWAAVTQISTDCLRSNWRVPICPRAML